MIAPNGPANRRRTLTAYKRRGKVEPYRRPGVDKCATIGDASYSRRIARLKSLSTEHDSEANPLLPRIIHQFWDRSRVPPDVARCVDTWRHKNGDWTHMLWDDKSAGRMLHRQFGAEAARCFHACTVPAMRADVFRIGALLAFGGVYVDADAECRRPLDKLIKHRCLLYYRNVPGKRWLLYNAFMVAERGHPFARKSFAAILTSIKKQPAQKPNDVSRRTGPDLLTSVLRDKLTEGERASVTLRKREEVVEFVKKKDLRYSREEGTWKDQMRSREIVDWSQADAALAS